MLKKNTDNAVAKAAPLIPTISYVAKGLVEGMKIKFVNKVIHRSIKFEYKSNLKYLEFAIINPLTPVATLNN